MIVTRTPFRVTLGGGGTDLPAFYEKHGGYILALGIDKYMYVALNVPYADRKVRLHYTQSEVVDHVGDLKHELAREALRAHDIVDAIEIASLADLPAGTGLGSSSCYLVGLLNAIRTYRARPVEFSELAEEACRIELEILKKPIGKQDQYMAAASGLTELVISRSGDVAVRRLSLPGYAIGELVANTHLYYLNVQRSTIDILEEQTKALRVAAPAETRQATPSEVERALQAILEIGSRIGDAIRAMDFDRFGTLMHEHWLAKKRLSGRVSVPIVEQIYDIVREKYGVLGGKVVGAGGGGFLMLYCPADRSHALTEFMTSLGLPRLTYAAEFEGSKVITNVMSARSVDYHSSDRVDLPAAGKSSSDVFV